MSLRRLALVVSPDARRDIRSLLMYSQQQWGQEQRKTYKSNLDRAMKQLLQFPDRGPARDDISPGLRNLVVDAHIVYYRVTDRSVIINRVLHEKMDPTSRIVS